MYAAIPTYAALFLIASKLNLIVLHTTGLSC